LLTRSYHRKPFPVTAKQLRYLIERKYIDFPSISKKEIWDKSKFDTAAKCFALIPVINLLANTIARYPQGLPVTPLEVFTLSFLPPSLGTIFFTLSKPLNVSSPVELKTQKTIREILVESGDAARDPYSNTPLDFVETVVYQSSSWSEKVHCFTLRQGLQTRPMQRKEVFLSFCSALPSLPRE